MVNEVVSAVEPAPVSAETAVLAIIEEGEALRLNEYLAGLMPRDRDEILGWRFRSRQGASLLQITLRSMNEEIIHIACGYMDKDLKRQVVKLRDDLGRHSLHDASSSHSLPLMEGLLASFSKEEQLELIQDADYKGNSCLQLAAFNPSSDVMNFFLALFTSGSTNMLWQCIMKPNKEGKTVGHILAEGSTEVVGEMFRMLGDVAKGLDRVPEFLLQPNRSTTLLHSLVTANMSNAEKEQYVLASMNMIITMAENEGCKSDLLWKRSVDRDNATALYHLASIRKPYHSSVICDHLLTQVDKSHVTSYIMAKNTKYEQNALHISARHEHLHVLQSLVKHLPANVSSRCLMERSANGSTPLHLAAGKSAKSVKQLIRYLTIDDRQRIVMSGDAHGNTPLLIAISESQIDAANLLITKDWVPGHMVLPLTCARNNYGWTIIHFSCIPGDSTAISLLDFFAKSPYIKLNTMIHHIDTDGNTALHIAALLHRPVVIESLMSKYIKKCEHRKLLLRENKDGLRASQLCDASDHVVRRYLQPLVYLGWNDALIITKKTIQLKSETERKMVELEKLNGIQPTSAQLPANGS